MIDKAYVSAINSKDYLVGLISVNEQIKKKCKYPFFVICTQELYDEYEKLFEEEKIYVVIKENIDVPKEITDRMIGTDVSHWINTFFKLNIFSLDTYSKLVYVDLDMLINDCLDELFEKNAISAVDDGDFMLLDYNKGMNSGLMVFTPNVDDYRKLINNIVETGKERHYLGDQGIIQNTFKWFIGKSRKPKYNHIKE